jgi:periplasmic divalent cation tolerance protein
MTDFISVTITSATLAEAEILARTLVDERLAACVTILPAVHSTYRWQGKIETGAEVMLIAKTRADSFSRLEARVKSLNSYACPCIVATPIVAGHAPYLAWLEQETI